MERREKEMRKEKITKIPPYWPLAFLVGLVAYIFHIDHLIIDTTQTDILRLIPRAAIPLW